jgi:hypothetical protein
MHILSFSSVAADRSGALRGAAPSKALLAAAWVAAGLLGSCAGILVVAPAALPAALTPVALLAMQMGLTLVSAMAFGLATRMTLSALQRGHCEEGTGVEQLAVDQAVAQRLHASGQRVNRAQEQGRPERAAGPAVVEQMDAHPERVVAHGGLEPAAPQGEERGAAPVGPVAQESDHQGPNGLAEPPVQVDEAGPQPGPADEPAAGQLPGDVVDQNGAAPDAGLQVPDAGLQVPDAGLQVPAQDAQAAEPARGAPVRRASWAPDVTEVPEPGAIWRARADQRQLRNSASRQARQARFLARQAAAENARPNSPQPAAAEAAPAAAPGPGPSTFMDCAAAGSGARLPALSPRLNQPRTPSWQERSWGARQRAAAIGSEGFSREQLLESGVVYQIDLHFEWLKQMQAALASTQPPAGSPESNLLGQLRERERLWRERLLRPMGAEAQELLQQLHDELIGLCAPLAGRGPGRGPGGGALSPWEICVDSLLSQWLAKPLQAYTAPLMASLDQLANNDYEEGARQRLSALIARSGRSVAALRSTGEKISLAWDNTMRATAIRFDSIHETNPSAELLRVTVRRPADPQLHTVRVVRSPVVCQQLQSSGGGQVKRALGAFFANVVGAGSAAPDTMKVVPEVRSLLDAGRKIQYLTLLDGQAKGEVVEPGSIRALRALSDSSQEGRSPLFSLLEVNLNRWTKGARHGTNGFERLAQQMRSALAPWIEPDRAGRIRCPGLQQRLPAMEQLAKGVMMAQELQGDGHLKTYLLTLAALVRIQLILEEVPDFDIAACKDGMDRAGALNMVSSALLVWLSAEDPQQTPSMLETVVAQCLAACFLAKGLPINESWGGAARHALDTLEGLIADPGLWERSLPEAKQPFCQELKELFADPENRFGEILKVSLPNEAVTIDPAAPSIAWYRGALRSPEQADRLYARMMDAAPFRGDRRVVVPDQEIFESQQPSVVARAVYPLILQQVRPELIPSAASHIRDGRRAHDGFDTQCMADAIQQPANSTRSGRWAMAIRSDVPGDDRTWYVGGDWHLSAPDITGERALDFSIGPRTWLLMQD